MKTNNKRCSTMKTKGLQTVTNVWKYAASVALLFILGVGNVWGSSSKTYYATMNVAVASTGGGTVYVNASGTTSQTESASSTSSSTSISFNIYATASAGYKFTSWSGSGITFGSTTTANTTGSISTSSQSSPGTSKTATASFVVVGVTAVDNTSIDLAPTNASADYPFTVTFTTTNKKDLNDFTKTPATADGKFTITSWTQDGDNVIATGKFNGDGTYGGASRNNSTTVTLASLGTGGGSKSCNVTANFPALEFVSATATDVFTTTSDATKTGTAVFNFNYGAEDDFPTAPTFTHTSGAGAFTVVGDPVIEPNFTDGTCKVTVEYQFNPNGTAGTTKEELKITSVGGLVSSVTVTGEAEAEATDDAKVIASDGETLIYQGDWATALSKANTAANAGCTLQLLRDVDLGTLAATQSVTNTFTLDLNGKTLRGTVSSSVPRLLYVNKASKTLTIIDSKTGGKISATGTYANALYCIQINNGNVILNSGSIEITNENKSQTTADRLYATGVYVNSGKTFTMNGGSIAANRGARDAYGIYVAASATARGKATINNGTINVNSNTYAYGIRGYGDIIINNGTINAETLTGAYAFGVYVRAAASATASSGYAGSLSMSGGTINSTSKTSYAYGIYMQTSTVGTGETETPEGTHSNQECGVLKITGGTIRVINDGNVASTNQYAYGIYMDGDYSSKSAKHITQTIKNLNLYVEGSRYIYGIYAAAGAQTNSACNKADVALTDNTVEVFANQSVTAYAVYVGAASRTIYTAGSAVYAGEYAAAAKATINSGTYTARTTTTSAYAVCSATRAKTTFAPDTTLGGNAEAYPTIIIKGGEFNAYPTTTTARAVSSGGNTTITGGTFNAIAGTSTAYGIYSVAGDLNVTGVEVNAEATGTAVGVYVDCAVATITGFSYYTNATLKNLTVTATTRTGTEADGVMIANYKRNLTPATLKSDSSSSKWSTASYLMYEKIYNYGEFAVAPKCTIIGGTYTAKAATTTAYGVRLNGPAISADSDGDGNVAVAYGQLDIDNAEIIAQTNGTTTCYGVWAGGPTTINRCNITASSKTTTCCGLLIEAGKTTLTNSTITATGDATVRGIYVNARIAAVSSTQNVNTEFAGVAGMECIGELEATNNTVTATATNGNTAYGIYLYAVKGNTASGPFAGDHAIAGKATINSGKYTATATGTTAYGIGMTAQQKQGDVIARPECTVNAGKFWGAATGGTDGSVDGVGQMNYMVLKGGFYNVNTNLSKYVYEGLNVNSLSSGSEYDEGYRFTISSGTTGDPVCKVYQNGSTDKGSYATLKEALQFVNSNTANTYTVVMIANHTLPAGNYVIPQKVTLIIPNSLTQKAAQGTKPSRTEVNVPAPVQLVMLTLDNGVNMTVYGGIETNAQQNVAAGGQAISGAPTGNYGRLHLVEGSKITLESGANLNCWGYTTGKGEITAMSGSTIREGFQLGYWRGGTATSSMLNNKNTWHAFPVTDYFIQNVEAPIMFRPGSQLLGYSAVTVSFFGTQQANDIKLVGTSGALFLMDNADASADTWVKKEYDPATDRAVWTVNSGAKLGDFSFSLAGETVESKDYYMPISNNMTVYINEGEFTVTQDALLIPGAQIIISKLGKLTVSSGKRLFVMDNEDWPGFRNKDDLTKVTRYYYNATYSPSWTTNPRTLTYPPTTTPLPDAEIFVHGTTEGQYYTTEHGANIHSTNEDAGVVRFIAAAGANTSIKHIVNTNCDLYTINFTSAKLKNEDASNPYTSTAGTVAGDAYTYMDQMWVNVRENGCLLDRTDGTGTHHLAHPSDVVAVVANTDDNAYHSETGSRNFIFTDKTVTTAGCTWWEAEKVTTGDHVGDYMANQDRYDNYGGYYYWDNSAGFWKPRTVTVTWKNYDGTALATYSNVQYNTSPHYSSASPKVPANSNIATYAWTGWDDPDGNFYSKDETLPRATGNITYTAHIQENKFEYLITFKNAAGKVMYSAMFEAGTTPECPAEYLVQSPTTSQVFSTPVTWSPALASVTGSQTYTATFTASPRKYTVTFVDYDMSFLADTIIGYGNMAAYPTLADEPYRESTDAYSYEWLGWTKALATVTKDVTYIAKYKQTTIKYRVVFKSDCWGQNDGDEGCVEKIHSQKDYALGATVTVPANPSRPQTAQYTYAFAHWDPAVGPVEAGGATYTAVYTKTPRAYAITYKDKDNKTFTGTHGSGYPTTHTYGSATPLVNPTRTGYTFEGWYSVADCSSGKITAVPADVAAAYTVYANWTPNTNTAYIVKHFKQNIDGTYNTTPDETDNLTGTTATSVTPDRKTYTGFTSPSAQTKSILADGSLVIEYKYTRNSYKLTWALAGGKVTEAGTGAAVDATGSPYINVKYDDAITAPTVARTGYTFAGWHDGTSIVTPASKMPATATTYTAQWNPITYNITYLDQNGAAFTGTNGSSLPATHTYGTATTLVNAEKTGYTFKGWFIAADCSGSKLTSLSATGYTADITLHALWAANTNTPYMVKHYQQNIEDDNYTEVEADRQNKTGTTATQTVASAKTYTGFTAQPYSQEEIAPDGSTIVEIYYNRNKYDITWVDGYGNTIATDNVKYGATLVVPTATHTGYTFAGWKEGSTAVTPSTMPARDVTYMATWNCVSPSNLSIASTDNKWDFCAGESMTLTVSGSNIAAEATYQWQKWDGSSWDNIIGATSASYTTSMTGAKGGQYCCAVTNPGGSCTATSGGVWVRVWQLHIGDNDIDFTYDSGTIGSKAVALNSNTQYQFKLKDNTGGWFGLNGKTVTRTEDAFALNGTGSDVNIAAGLDGNYIFTINYADKNNPTIAITYPVADQPAGKNIYFDKSVIADWGDKIYYRIGHPTYNTNNGDNAWTLVPGTDNFYTTQTIEFGGFEAWQIANNASWSGDKNSIYKVDGSGYAITRATDFQKYVVGENGVTIVPTAFNNSESGCNYWHVAVTEGMLTHTATIAAPTHGTITIANAAQSLSATATTANIPHRTILTITATPATGYKLSTLTVNGEAFTSGNTHILSADATIAATFSPITYTVHFNANGATGSMSDESFLYDEEKALTSNSFTRAGYSFEGWAMSAGGSVVYSDGQSVSNLSSTDGETIDLYAIWSIDDTEADLDIVDWSASTLTINANGWKASGWPYVINGVPYYKDAAGAGGSSNYRAADRTLTVSYSGDADSEFEIIVMNADGTPFSKRRYTIPHIYDASATLSGTQPASVIYVHSGTLTVSANTTVNRIYVAPNAELDVNSGVTLTVDTLVLRTSPWAAAILENEGTITATKTYYTRQVADNSGYFQFALPLASNIEDTHLSDYSKCTYGKSWILKSYSESLRAKNGNVNTETTSNWVLLEKKSAGKTTIAATTGFELYSNSQYYREFCFPVDLNQAGKTTSVHVTHTHYDDGAGAANEGWNALCSPLLGKFVQDFGGNPEDGLKVSELLDNGQYWQHVLNPIYPAVPFYYQAPQTGDLKFSTKLLLNAPRRAWNASVPTQWLQLTINDDKGRMLDETNIYTHPEKFDASYETGYDVAKQSLTGGKATIYTELACGKLAFAAIPDSIAETRIPVTVYANADREYTFSVRENDYLTRLQYVLLHDTEMGTVTDLLSSDYTCELTQGTTAGRFYLQCVFAQEASTVTTGSDNISDDMSKENLKAQKIIYQDKVYIIYQGRVYDMTGRQCELK